MSDARAKILEPLAAWPARRPWAALTIAAVLLAAALLAIAHTSADTSLESVLSQDDPASAAMIRIARGFPSADEMLLLVSVSESQSQGRRRDVPRLLDFAERFDAALRRVPDSQKLIDGVLWQVDEQTKRFFTKELVPSAMYYLDDASLSAARQRLSRPAMDEQLRRNEAMLAAPGPAADALSQALLQDPLRLHEFLLARFAHALPFAARDFSLGGTAAAAFVSPDGRSLLIRIRGTHPPGDIEFSKRITAAVDAAARSVNTDGLELDLSGAYAIATASERAMRRDSIANVIESVVALQLLFILLFRRPVRLFLLAFAPVAIGLVYGFGLHYLYSTTLAPPTAVVGAILAGVAIDQTTHYLTQYQSARRRGMACLDALIETSVSLFPSLLAASATTILGFGAIAWSSIAALRDFAVVGSLGLAGALAATLWVLPAIVRLTDGGRLDSATRQRERFDLLPLLRLIARHQAAVLVAMASLSLALIAVVAYPGVRLAPEDDLTVLHPRPNPPLDAQAKIARRMGTSADSLLVHLSASSADDLVRLAHRVEQRLSTDRARGAGITGTFGLSTLLPDPDVVAARRAAMPEREARRIVADFRAAVADSNFSPEAYEPYAQFLQRLLTTPAPPALTTLRQYPHLAENLLSRDTLAAVRGHFEAITLAFVDHPIETRQARQVTVGAARSALAGLDGATLTGLSVIGLDTEQAVHRDLPRMLLSSVLLVMIYLLVQYRSVTATLLALVPLAFSLLLVIAVMRLTGRKLNAVNLIAIPLLVGITVDYGIFLIGLWHQRGAAPFGRDLAELSSTFRAITVCAASTVIGFGTLLWTSVPAFQSLGWVVAVGVSSAMAATLLLQAPLLMRRAATLDREAANDAPAAAPSPLPAGEGRA